MGLNCIEEPDIVRLHLPCGYYIDVKRALNAGEYQDVFAAMASDPRFGEAPKLDLAQVGVAKAVEYLVGWSLCGRDDTPLPYSLDTPREQRAKTLRSLKREIFREITQAIDAHEAKEDEARDARKKIPAGSIA